MLDDVRQHLRRFYDQSRRFGPGAALRFTGARMLQRAASVEIVHLVTLRIDGVPAPRTGSGFERKRLTPSEVRRHASVRDNKLAPSFARRAAAGRDLCFGTLHQGRLANYGWYALGSIEAEHAAGTAIGLPPNVAYMYKLFTHPDFRGRRLNEACMARAATELRAQGVERLVAFVRWGNEASLRSCERLGFQRMGMLVVGPGGPIRIPPEARRVGLVFGAEAQAALESRRVPRTAA